MRALLVSWGSLGDFFPFLSVAKALKQRGHEVTLAGNPKWAPWAREEGIRFRETFAESSEDVLHRHPEMLDQGFQGLVSLHHLVDKGIMPVFEDTFQVLQEEIPRHDVVVSHHFVFPVALLSEVLKTRWVTVCLAPGVTPSAWQKPAASWSPSPKSSLDRFLTDLLWKIGRRLISPVVDKPLNLYRAKIGLPSFQDHFFSARSRDLTLHLYSPEFSPKPPDWDKSHVISGFCFNDLGELFQPDPRLELFLSEGDKPILFTLGSTVVEHPGDFYQQAYDAVESLGERAIFLIGHNNHFPSLSSPKVIQIPYAPHDWIMPRCKAVVHQCGVGTLAESLRAGVPAVGCPRAFDQPNNSSRLLELGVGSILKPGSQTSDKIKTALASVLQSEVLKRAQELGELIRQESGAENAAIALEQFLLCHSCP